MSNFLRFVPRGARRALCLTRGHKWVERGLGFQRYCTLCETVQLADFIRGGWYEPGEKTQAIMRKQRKGRW